MIRDALAWWSGQMLDLVPARFTRPDPSEAGALLIEPLPAGARLILREGGTDRVLATLPLSPARVADLDASPGDVSVDPGDAEAFMRAVAEVRREGKHLPVLLRLPAGAALTREVVLPIAAEAGLDRVLAYEMDRLTPFSAAETVFTFRVTGRDRAAGRVFVHLVLLPRAPLQPLLSLLAGAGAEAAAIEVGTAGENGAPTPLRIPLAHAAPVSERRQRNRLRAAYAACAMLALLVVVLPFVLQQIGFAALDRRIAALRPDVQTVQALQARITGGSTGALMIRAERARLGDAIVVMAALTTVIPDDSYLTDLALRRGELTVSGQSPSAARLIPAISADPAFRAPTFTAPVTRIEGQGQELFSIKAGVAH